MLSMLPWRLGFLATLVLLTAGCGQRVTIEKDVTLPPGEERYYFVDAPRKQQTVTVTTKSGGVPIDLWVIHAATEDEARSIVIKQSGKTKGVIGNRLEKADPELEVQVPADTPYVVVVANPPHGNKEASVAVKIEGK
jgi:hypothetical protein